MCKLLLLAASAGFVTGCSTVVADPPPNAVTAQEAVDPDAAHCRTIADERANDALVNGYDFQIEESVFREAYQDCMTWRARRPG